MATQTAVPEVTLPIPLTESETRAAWLEERKSFIGGSEVFELLNIPQYGKGCARALGYRKAGFSPDIPDNMDADLLERGNELEAIVADKYERETGRKVRRAPAKVRRHPDYPYLGVHTDRTILAGHGDVTETGDLELKTHREGPFLRLLREGVPPGHSLQVQHSMLITGHKWGAFAVLWPDGWKMRHFDMLRSETVIDEIKRQGDHFWSLREKNELPSQLADSEDVRCKTCQFRITCRGEAVDEQLAAQIKAEKEGKVKLVTIQNPELAQTIADRELLAAEIKAAEEQKELLDEKIKAQLPPSVEVAYLVDRHKVYNKPTSSSRLDEKAIKLAEPEIAAKYSRTVNSSFYRIYEL